MSAQHYIAIFVVFSFIGWIIDTSYRSVAEKKYAPGTKYFFDPVYGLGAVVLTLVYSNANFSIPLQIFTAGLLLSLVELFSGIFIHKMLGRRIWDYRDRPLNFMGHIDALHSFYWVLLAFAYYLLGQALPLY